MEFYFAYTFGMVGNVFFFFFLLFGLDYTGGAKFWQIQWSMIE